MMFRWIKNSQEYKRFEIDAVTIKKSMTEYHISGLPFILTQQSMGEMSRVSLVTCLLIFTLLKHLMMLLKLVQFFSGLHLYTLSKALMACKAMQLRCFKVETLLNNAFKSCLHAYSRNVASFSVSF